MTEKIYATISSTLKIEIEQLNDDLGPGDIAEWDSLAHQGLILALEEEYNIKLDIDDVLDMETVGDIIEIIEKKLVN
jgi:acyl carrier protein